jgi:excisionase family DNA binding protein
MYRTTSLLLDADSLPEILTARELEAFIRLDVKTIYSYVQANRIPHVRMGSNLRFLKREILAWLEERHYRPRPFPGTTTKWNSK